MKCVIDAKYLFYDGRIYLFRFIFNGFTYCTTNTSFSGVFEIALGTLISQFNVLFKTIRSK